MKRIWRRPAGWTWEDWKQATAGAHTLVAGCTGSGKSVLLHTLIYNLLRESPNECEFVLVDPKRVELYKYRNLPHALKYCQEPDEASNALDWVIEEMEKRFKFMQKKGYTSWHSAHLYVIIDELADLMVTSQRVIMPKLQRIAQLGRACGIHLLCATQAPNRKVIPAELTLNFTERICLHCASPIESRQVIGVSGGELLPQYGEALYARSGAVERMYVPMTDDSEIDARIKYWLKARPKYTLF